MSENILKNVKILIVLKKLIFMDNNDTIYNSFTLLVCWNIPVWIKRSTHVFIIWCLRVNMILI